jgi:hypothetical protein
VSACESPRRRDKNKSTDKLQGFQDPRSCCQYADLFPNVDRVLVGNRTRRELSSDRLVVFWTSFVVDILATSKFLHSPMTHERHG